MPAILKSEHVFVKPIAGDLFVVKKNIDVLDYKGSILNLKKNDIVRLVEITDANPSMRLNRKTKFIANWSCKFFIDKRHFTLFVQNTATDSVLFEFFDCLTEELANKINPE